MGSVKTSSAAAAAKRAATHAAGAWVATDGEGKHGDGEQAADTPSRFQIFCFLKQLQLLHSNVTDFVCTWRRKPNSNRGSLQQSKGLLRADKS